MTLYKVVPCMPVKQVNFYEVLWSKETCGYDMACHRKSHNVIPVCIKNDNVSLYILLVYIRGDIKGQENVNHLPAWAQFRRAVWDRIVTRRTRSS